MRVDRLGLSVSDIGQKLGKSQAKRQETGVFQLNGRVNRGGRAGELVSSTNHDVGWTAGISPGRPRVCRHGFSHLECPVMASPSNYFHTYRSTNPVTKWWNPKVYLIEQNSINCTVRSYYWSGRDVYGCTYRGIWLILTAGCQLNHLHNTSSINCTSWIYWFSSTVAQITQIILIEIILYQQICYPVKQMSTHAAASMRWCWVPPLFHYFLGL
jgi:hypothetical protein